MFDNINFKRFDRSSDVPRFSYQSEPTAKDYESDPRVISMENPGFNLKISVQNYMAESVMLGANVRSTPTKIKSLIQDNTRPRNDQRNYVIIKIHNSENPSSYGTKGKPVQVSKSEIRIPGSMLNQGSVFIDELDCYLTTESNLEATRELIARDVADRHDEAIVNLPSSLIIQDPTAIYHQYKSLVEYCIKRQDLIQVRTGFDYHHREAPDVVKEMRIAILDHYFVPFAYDNLVFDPTLGPDEFVIENLHLAAKGEFRFTYTELSKLGATVLDADLRDTMFGKFYGMALFASESRHRDYVFQRKSIERFHDEQLFLAERSGDPMLKEEITTLRRTLDLQQAAIQEKDQENITLRADKKRLTADVNEREKTIKEILDHKDARMSTAFVMKSLDNEDAKLSNESVKLENDRTEQDHRATGMVLSHKATMYKYVADMMKSGWGIATAITGGFLALFALLKKYNVRISMG
jgi:hypothetical protein